MPAVMHRGSRRRTISEINMVPFIDVISVGTVDLPTVGAARQHQEPHVIELVLAADGTLRARLDGVDQGPLGLAQVPARVKEMQRGKDDVPVLISADKSVRYEKVVEVMDAAQKGGVKRLALMTKSANR